MNFSLILITISLLVVNTSQPLVSFWMEFLAGLGLIIGIIFLILKEEFYIRKIVAINLFVFSIFLLLDCFFRKNIYYADNYIFLYYIFIFALAFSFGENKYFNFEKYAVFSVVFAIFSVGIAICQWLGIELDRMYFKEINAGGRVYANVGQPNHLATFLVWSGIFLIYLNHFKKISNTTFFLVFLILIFSQSLTQSRTSVLTLFLNIFVILLVFEKENKIFVIKRFFVWIFGVVVFSLLTPWGETFFILNKSERNIYEAGIGTSRTEHWLSMLEAIIREPVFGYGWLHAAEAQIRGTEYEIKESIFQYSHNFFLDSILWAGIPFGLIVIYGFFRAIKGIIQKKSSLTQNYCFLLVVVFVIHSMLEFPYAYLHLLIPAGIFLGYCYRDAKVKIIYANDLSCKIIFSVVLISSIVIVFDYYRLERDATELRFEYANFSNKNEKVEVKSVILLDNIKSLVENSYRKPNVNISNEEINELNKVTYRFGTQRLLFHSAMAHGFRGEALDSKKFLKEICKIHSKNICDYSRKEWLILMEEYPESIGKISFPDF